MAAKKNETEKLQRRCLNSDESRAGNLENFGSFYTNIRDEGPSRANHRFLILARYCSLTH